MRARSFIDALERLEHAADVGPIAALFTADAEIGSASEPDRVHYGTDGARTFWRAYRESFSAIRSEFRNVVESGDAAILEWRSDGRTAAGDNVSYAGTSVLEFAGDRVKRFHAYFDPADLTGRADRHGAVGG